MRQFFPHIWKTVQSWGDSSVREAACLLKVRGPTPRAEKAEKDHACLGPQVKAGYRIQSSGTHHEFSYMCMYLCLCSHWFSSSSAFPHSPDPLKRRASLSSLISLHFCFPITCVLLPCLYLSATLTPPPSLSQSVRALSLSLSPHTHTYLHATYGRKHALFSICLSLAYFA